MKDYKLIERCLLCDNNIYEILHIGDTPLANEFVDDPVKKQDMFPLNLVQCSSCGHVQLDCIVNENRLYSNYLYVTGTSSVNIQHFKDYADSIMDEFFSYHQPSILDSFIGGKDYGYPEDLIIDIGSNDGTFLNNFNQKIRRVGVDPAKNLLPEAIKNGVKTICKFFDEYTALEIKNEIGVCGKSSLAKVITCNNMFAHNSDLDTIIKGISYLLHENGVFIFENSYLLDICDKTLIDLIYHEHMHHHHIRPLKKLFEKYDMDIYNVKRLPNHGGSIRVYTCYKGKRKINNNVNDLINLEKNIDHKLLRMNECMNNLKLKLQKLLQTYKEQNKSIAIYGTPAKATTLMYALDINEKMIDFAIDDNPLKQGTFTPGKHIPVYTSQAIKDKNPDVLLVLAWNFAESIMKQHPYFKGEWIIPLPELKIIQL